VMLKNKKIQNLLIFAIEFKECNVDKKKSLVYFD
jgi:hypothetical protein